ncbi:MAG TPA: hypothetical protein VFZ44_05640 [Pyrinomonadaceae bacterium]
MKDELTAVSIHFILPPPAFTLSAAAVCCISVVFRRAGARAGRALI